MGTAVAISVAIVCMSEDRRNVTFIQNQQNWFRTSVVLKFIRIKFRGRLYPRNLTLNAMRLLPWSCYIDFMEISTFWQNSGAEIQTNRFCKLSYDGNEQLNRKQHTPHETFWCPSHASCMNISTIKHRECAQKSAVSEKSCQILRFLLWASQIPPRRRVLRTTWYPKYVPWESYHDLILTAWARVTWRPRLPHIVLIFRCPVSPWSHYYSLSWGSVRKKIKPYESSLCLRTTEERQ
jgi:hypothetical protein